MKLTRLTALAAIALALLAGLLAAEAQQAVKSYRVSFLALTPGEDTTVMRPFLERLNELGYREGENMTLEYRSAEGRAERLPQLALELVRGRPDVLIAGFGTLTAQAAKAATTTIPIIFTTVGDPVGAGLVTSLGRPGGNVTGMSGVTEIGGKHLQLLQELAPGRRVFAVLLNPDTPSTRLALMKIKAAAEATQSRVETFEVRNADQVFPGFEAAVRSGAGGVIVLPDPLTLSLREQIAAFSAKFRFPAVFPSREWAEGGGLISYGANRRETYRRAADYVDISKYVGRVNSFSLTV
jgi:putative ABC transport system substrate-binding protein